MYINFNKSMPINYQVTLSVINFVSHIFTFLEF